MTNNTILAFTASLLSVAAATLSYFINRDTDETKVIQYYLSTSCLVRGNAVLDEVLDLWGDDETWTEIQEDVAFTKQDTYKSEGGYDSEINGTIVKKHPSRTSNLSMVVKGNTVRNGITIQEKENFMYNRGKTLALAIDISEVFGVPNKNIEIGASMITKYGLMTHVIHFIYDKDLAEMEEELHLTHKYEKNVYVTPRFYVQQLYHACEKEITEVFRAHFDLNNDFSVKFVSSLSKKKNKEMAKHMSENTTAYGTGSDVEPELSTRKSVLHKAATMADLTKGISTTTTYRGISARDPDTEYADDFDITEQIEVLILAFFCLFF